MTVALFPLEPAPVRVSCGRCHRMLTDAVSIARGLGPLCARILGGVRLPQSAVVNAAQLVLASPVLRIGSLPLTNLTDHVRDRFATRAFGVVR